MLMPEGLAFWITITTIIVAVSFILLYIGAQIGWNARDKFKKSRFDEDDD